MSEFLEIVQQVACPECETLLYVDPAHAIRKIAKGHERKNDDPIEKTYVVTCGNKLCKEYRKVKFLPARVVAVGCFEVD